jgi:hypothetical protein
MKQQVVMVTGASAGVGRATRPSFRPEVIGHAIVWAADHPRREMYVGSSDVNPFPLPFIYARVLLGAERQHPHGHGAAVPGFGPMRDLGGVMPDGAA